MFNFFKKKSLAKYNKTVIDYNQEKSSNSQDKPLLIIILWCNEKLNIESIKKIFSLSKNSKKDKDYIDLNVISNNNDKNDLISEKKDGIIDIFNNQTTPLSWIDNKNKLIWEVKNERNFNNKFTYEEALKYALTLNRKHYDKSGKWRVPTVDKLMSLGVDKLFDYRHKSAKFHARMDWKKARSSLRNGKLFVIKPFSGFMNQQIDTWYWSSSKVDDFSTKNGEKIVNRLSDTMWSVNFFEGGNYHNNKKERNSVICVRTLYKN